LSFSIFQQLAPALKTEFALKFFKTGRGRSPVSYAYNCMCYHNSFILFKYLNCVIFILEKKSLLGNVYQSHIFSICIVDMASYLKVASSPILKSNPLICFSWIQWRNHPVTPGSGIYGSRARCGSLDIFLTRLLWTKLFL